MATRAHEHASAPLPAILAAIPRLPRPILSRLTARLIERLDEIDGDPDLEDDTEDCGGLDEEMEREQMAHDVPNLPIWSIEPAADGKRVLLGRSGERWIGSSL